MAEQSISAADFPIARKGFEQEAVRWHLANVEQDMRSLERQVTDLQAQLTVAQAPVIDEAIVAQFLGAESAQLLTRAHDAARELTMGADRKATVTINEANADALRVRREAKQDTERLRKETEADCAAKVEAAEERAYQLVKDAEEQRKRILADVANRRDRAGKQLQQLMNGRDQLTASIANLRQQAKDVTTDLEDFRLGPTAFTNLADTLEPEQADVEAAATTIARGKADISS
jgi:chromosome segregation ATPase